MGDLILAGVLMWLAIFVWWGTDLILRSDPRGKVVGGCLFVLALVPGGVAMWLGT
jgi:hypothetical protein